MHQELLDIMADLDNITGVLKNEFVAKDELIELMVVSAIAQEHLLIVGPPGTAKSELVKRFALRCSPRTRSDDGTVAFFEYLLTRFTEPNELFGPVDIQGYQKGHGHRRITDGMLPKAEIAFLDEVFKANSAILNALLTVLNERAYFNGSHTPDDVPLLCAIGATNEVPEESSLAALYDRFLIRVWTDNVEEARFHELCRQGWELERKRIQEGFSMQVRNITTTEKIRMLYRALDEVQIEPIAGDYREVIRRIRAEGIDLSDRRVIKLVKLIAASALRRKSLEANSGDFWVLKHIWNDPEQIPHLQNLVNPYLEDYAQDQWSAERELDDIAGDITVLAARQAALRTDADYADFLHTAERLRREVLKHSAEETEKTTVLDRLNAIIEDAMKLLETE